jgi:hypothetical protein
MPADIPSWPHLPGRRAVATRHAGSVCDGNLETECIVDEHGMLIAGETVWVDLDEYV